MSDPDDKTTKTEPKVTAPKEQKFDFHSNDGVPVPAEGVEFTFTLNEGKPEERIESIVLHDCLKGLNMKPNTNGNTQARTFASFALQMEGIATEADILARWPHAGIQKDGTSRAYGVLNTMMGIVEARRQSKAAGTMRENRTQVSTGQTENATRLMPMLKEKGSEWQPLIDQMAKMIVEDSEENPLGGDMSIAIAKAYKVLGIQRNRSTTQTGPRVAEPAGEEPF